MASLEGQRLGQYEIIEEIAKGGMSTIYRAQQTSINRDIALKLLPPNFTHDDTFLERFSREVEVFAALQHPHILPIYDYGEANGSPFIVMAYIRGGTLGDLIARGPMPLPEVVRLTKQMAQALDFAHSKGIIHRDFKPGNVLIDEQGNTYLADFGLAKVMESNSNITGTSILGTPAYMAPEQASSDPLTHAIDIYALGVTLYNMLTGKAPYAASTASAALVAHIVQPIPNILKENPDLPPALQTVVQKALAKKPDDRYQTAGELARDLETVLMGGGSVPQITTQKSGLLMTNMIGHVIFADNALMSLLKRHQSEARTIIGRPLDSVLGIPASTSAELIDAIKNMNEIVDLELTITDAHGKQKPVSCYAVATRDSEGAFVGSDITLTVIVSDTTPPSGAFDPNQQTMNSKETNFLQIYFVKQVDSLYTLIEQWAGRRVAHQLQEIINETGQRNVWPINMTDGHITVEIKRTDVDMYQALLARAMTYAAEIIGKQQVIRELEYVNKNMDRHVIAAVQKMGLDELYKDLL